LAWSSALLRPSIPTFKPAVRGGPKSKYVQSLTCSDEVPAALSLVQICLVCVVVDGVLLDMCCRFVFSNFY
jgi:hypothetical protein